MPKPMVFMPLAAHIGHQGGDATHQTVDDKGEIFSSEWCVVVSLTLFCIKAECGRSAPKARGEKAKDAEKKHVQ